MKSYYIHDGKKKIRCQAMTKTSATARFAMMGYSIDYQHVILEGPVKTDKRKKTSKSKSPQ